MLLQMPGLLSYKPSLAAPSQWLNKVVVQNPGHSSPMWEVCLPILALELHISSAETV